jgi:HAD superfamily hydrolase (TIGR01459 family)
VQRIGDDPLPLHLIFSQQRHGRDLRPMNNAPPPMQFLSSVAGISKNRKAWLCDVWGVLHDGVKAFKPALAACHAFRDQGSQIVLISNSPNSSPGVIAHLDLLGVPRDCFDAIVTSGDVTRVLVEAELDKPMFHIGPESDKDFFEGLPVKFVPVAEAAVVVCTGLFDDEHESPEDYDGMLRSLAARRVPMICANPDLVVERGNRLLPCAGALALCYSALGQTVIQAGKPFRPIYDLALQKLKGAVERSEILAIGDGIDTDIKGACALGIESIYIVSQVHIQDEAERAAVDAALLDRVFADRPFRPAAAMMQLKW